MIALREKTPTFERLFWWEQLYPNDYRLVNECVLTETDITPAMHVFQFEQKMMPKQEVKKKLQAQRLQEKKEHTAKWDQVCKRGFWDESKDDNPLVFIWPIV